MRVEYTLAVRGSSIDEASNSLSVFEILEELNINVVGTPTAAREQKIVIPMQLLAVFLRQSEAGALSFQAEFRIEGPGAVELARATIPVKFEPHHKRFRVRTGLELSLTTSGRYTIHVQSDLDPNAKGQYSFDCTIQTTKPLEPMQGPLQ